MATKTLNTRIILRNDTKAAWQSANPVLRKGEIGIVFDPSAESDSKVVNFKIGDGVTAWNSLPFAINCDDVRDDLDKVAISLAREFNSAASYAEGDFVVYQYQLYVAKHQVAPAAFNPSDWSAINLADYLSEAIGHAMTAEVARADAAYASAGLASIVSDNVAAISANAAAIETLNATAGVAGSVEAKIEAHATYYDAAGTASAAVASLSTVYLAASYDAAITANQAAITTLNATAGVAGSVEYKIAQLAAPSSITATVSSLDDAVKLLNDSASVTGSVANSISVAIDEFGDVVQDKITAIEDIIGSGFSTSETVASAISEINSHISALEGNHYSIVQVLPATGEANVIYLVPKASGTGYKEWIYIQVSSNPDAFRWEEIGDTDIDLSDYYTKSEIDAQSTAYLAASYSAAIAGNTATIATVSGRVAAIEADYLKAADVYIFDCGNATTNISGS